MIEQHTLGKSLALHLTADAGGGGALQQCSVVVAVVVLCVAFDVRSILLQQQVVEYVLLAVRIINIAWVSSRSPYERRLFRTDFFVLGVDSDTLFQCLRGT